jgi:hypothetical protein
VQAGLKLFLILALFALPLTAEAMPSQVLGEGIASCKEFLSEPNMQSVRLEWVLGYISGENNQSTEGRLTGRSLKNEQTPLSWLQAYCQSNPLHPLIVAADHMRDALAQSEQ